MMARFVCAKTTDVPLQYGLIGERTCPAAGVGRPVSFHYHPFERTTVELN
jgi:hypothetical protein